MTKNILPSLLIGLILIPSLGLAGADASKDQIRKSTIPILTADAQHAPALPDNSNLYTIQYKATNPDAIEDLARLVRSFTPASSRIIPMSNKGLLQVSDTADSLKRAYTLIKENDVKPTPDMRKKWKELEKQADQKRN